jgi:hypothetical protein
MPVQLTYQRNCSQIQQFLSEIKNTPGIFKRLRVSFSRRVGLFLWKCRPLQAPLVRK